MLGLNDETKKGKCQNITHNKIFLHQRGLCISSRIPRYNQDRKEENSIANLHIVSSKEPAQQFEAVKNNNSQLDLKIGVQFGCFLF